MSNRSIVELYDQISKKGPLDIISSGRYFFSGLNYTKRLAADIAEKLKLQPSDQVLDLGCNLGIYHSFISKKVKSVIGVDAGKAIIEKAQRQNRAENVRYLAFDILGEWPKFEHRFSKVLVYSVIHFFESEAQVSQFLEKISEVLEPGGLVMFGEVRTTEKYEAFRSNLSKRKLPTLRDLRFKLNKWFSRMYLGEVKGSACTHYSRDIILKVASENGFMAKEIEQQSFHPFYNTCTDFIFEKKR